MKSKVPILRQTAWISFIPHLLVMVVLMLIWYQFDRINYLLYGASSYLVISQLLNRIIAREHRQGMKLVKSEDFENAIPRFQKSYDFFKENNWVDKYRYLTLLSSGKMSYQEMALNNIGFCYSQLGNIPLAKKYYTKSLDQFPENVVAKVALRFINSILEDNEKM